MKRNETREETLERLARDASSGKGAAKRFETFVKGVAKTPPTPSKAQSGTGNDVMVSVPDPSKTSASHGQCSILMPMQRVSLPRYSSG